MGLGQLNKCPKFEVLYFDFRNADQKKQVEQVLSPFIPLFPYWVNDLNVMNVVNPSEDADILGILTLPHYRKASLYIYPSYYSLTEEQRRQDMLHEISHAFFGPITQWFSERICTYFNEIDPTLTEFMRQEFIERLEGCTQDLSYAFWNILMGTKVPNVGA